MLPIPERIRDGLFTAFVTVGALAYIAARMILLVLTFTCLRAEPAGVFEATAWSTFLPHIG